jgi:hypothetical protein
MTIRGALAFAVGSSLMAAPVAAQDVARAGAPVGETEEIAANPWIPWAVAIVVAAIIAMVVLDDDEPASP